MRSTLLILLFILIASCDNAPTGDTVIVLQPLGDIPSNEVQFVFNNIKRLHPQTFLSIKIPLPDEAFYASRQRYRADSLIHFLSRRTSTDTVVIGLTQKDISTTKGKQRDWGVMGLGFCPGRACVVSSFRLSPRNKTTQFYKVALHELGHTQGLPHCQKKSCLMRDAEGRNPTDEETGFCKSCTNFLSNRNWHFQDI